VALLERILAGQPDIESLSERERFQRSILEADIADRKKAGACGALGASSGKDSAELGDIESQLVILRKMKAQQEERRATLKGPERERVEIIIVAISASIAESEQARGANTSAHLISGGDSRRETKADSAGESLVGKDVPYYLPGTRETGVVRLSAAISSQGASVYALRFYDEGSFAGSPREAVSLSRADIEELREGLEKVGRWSSQAQREGVRKIFSKSAVCVPRSRCQEQVGARLALNFVLYEDGATSAQIEVRKGSYQQPYNLSVENAAALRQHLASTLRRSDKHARNAALTTRDLNEKFQ
jgi:hypothetical protein